MTKFKRLNKKKVVFVVIVCVVIICLCTYVTKSVISFFSFNEAEITVKEKNDHVSFVAVGDNIIHERIFEFAKKQADGRGYNFKPCYQNIKKYISNHDLAFINQETLIAGDQINIQGYPVFNSPESLINDLEDTGFQLVNGATNHSMDHGAEGIFNSCKIWRQHKNITLAGLYDSQEDRDTIRLIKKNDITFSFLAYTFGVNEYTNYKNISRQLKKYPYMLAQFDEEQIKKDVARAKSVSDVVIVSAHWGIEGQHEITNFQKKYAQLFADLGVDLVVGTHSHLIQPIEWVKGKNDTQTLVIYSLGNFLSTMNDVDNQLEGMISLDFVKKENNIVIDHVVFTPLVNHFNDDVVTIYRLKDYNKTLSYQHSILKNQNDIIKLFKNKVKSIIGKHIKINM